MPETFTPQRKAEFNIAITLGYLLFILSLSEVAARFAIHLIRNIYSNEVKLTSEDRDVINSLLKGGKQYLAYDSDLGWVSNRNVIGDLYESNSLGIRSDKEYNPHKIQTGFTRILAFGDSFTHSDDVTNIDAWTTILENTNNHLEVLNYGVPAYGVDQAYLRFQKESINVVANIVIIGMMSENVYRHINTFRKFYQRVGGFPLGKPRFTEEDSSSIKLIPNWFSTIDKYHTLLTDTSSTLREVGKYDFYFNNKPPEDNCFLFKTPCSIQLISWLIRENIDRQQKDPWSGFLRYDMKSEGPRLTAKITRSFARSVIEKGMHPILIIFPNKTDYIQYKITGIRNYESLLKSSTDSGTEAWDAMEAFTEENKLLPYDAIFTKSSGHYNSEGNKRVAEWISKKLFLNY